VKFIKPLKAHAQNAP